MSGSNKTAGATRFLSRIYEFAMDRSRPQRELAERAIRELYGLPQDVPSKSALRNKALCWAVKEHLRKNGLPNVSDESILRAAKASRIVDRRKEAKSRDWADARRRHEASHLSIVMGQPQYLAVEVRNLSFDRLACLEQRRHRGSELWPSLGQLRGAHGEYVHLCPADDEAEFLEEPADLVLNISLDLDEQSSADKQGLDRMTAENP